MTIRRTAIASLAAVAALTLSACGSDDSDADTSAPATSEPAATEAAEEAPAASGDQPEWANPTTTPGEKISTVEVGDLTVDVYQVGTTKATKTGQFVDPENNEPIIAEGDEIVFVNYVVTNNGDDIDLGSSLVSVDARYENWPYLQGMDGIVDDALYEEQEVNDGGLAAGAFKDPSVYTLAKGQQFSFGENFRYEKGTGIEFDVTITPVDAAGDLIHDDRQEGTGTGTIS